MFEFKIWNELQWFELEHPYYLINLQWDDCYSDICDKMSEFEVFCWTRTKYGSSIALSNFQLDRNWFKFHLQWYWTDFFEMNNIEMISKKCSINVEQRGVGHLRKVIFNLIVWFKFQNDIGQITLRWWDDFKEMFEFKISNELQWFELEHPYYLINLQWDDCYSDICDKMSEFEVFCWTRTFWIRTFLWNHLFISHLKVICPISL